MKNIVAKFISATERHEVSCRLLTEAGWTGPNAKVKGSHGCYSWLHPSGATITAAKHGWRVNLQGQAWKTGEVVQNPEDAIPLVK